jgi:regulator of sirC expression with transglutaminase-like and TPR domain
MRHLEDIRGQFADLVKGPEDHIDLVKAALLIAQTAFPDLIRFQYTERLDRWADRLRSRLDASPSAGAILSNLNRILFDEEGFQGNQENYYDEQQFFEMLQWILAVDPEAADELKERGLLYEAMGNNVSAVKDLQRYLETPPPAADREMIEAKIKLLRSDKGWLH